MKKKLLISCFSLFACLPKLLMAQGVPEVKSFGALPDREGMAGMFAGISNGVVFCMGGANFPDKKPWEGGKKMWHDEIFSMDPKLGWVKLEEKLPVPLAYGVSVSYKNELILVGGNDDKEFHREVTGLTWSGHSFVRKSYPELPIPLANMAGALVGSVIVVAGGNSSFTGQGLNCCYALDLKRLSEGWVQLPDWPGPARNQPVGGSFHHQFYLFSGEAPNNGTVPSAQRVMLHDAYRLTFKRNKHSLTGSWEQLSDMPRSVTAAANPVPVNRKGVFLFWGGVEAKIALHKDPATHPGNDPTVLSYAPKINRWKVLGSITNWPARVTLPTVFWNGYWLFISGEVRPGIRTNFITGIQYN